MKRACLIFLMFLIGSSPMAQNEALIRSLDKTSSHIDGPNCWNGALFTAGVLHTKRFLHPEEWLYHLKTSCEEVTSPRAGDVGRLFFRDTKENVSEVHGFIYLSEDLIFAKHGESTQHGYQLMSFKEMMNQYGRTRECRMAGESRLDDPNCNHDLVYYRCQKSASLPAPWPSVHLLLEKFLFSEETKWRFKEKCDGEIFKNREELLNEMTDLFKDHQLENQENSQMISNLKSSFSHQLYNIQVSQRLFRCPDRKRRDRALNDLKDAYKGYLNTL